MAEEQPVMTEPLTTTTDNDGLTATEDQSVSVSDLPGAALTGNCAID